MASPNDLFKGIEGIEVLEGAGLPAVIVGIGAAILAPVLAPVLAQAGKPIAKAMIKESLLLYEKGKEVMAEATDMWEDMVAEAKYEIAQSQSSQEPARPETIVVED